MDKGVLVARLYTEGPPHTGAAIRWMLMNYERPFLAPAQNVARASANPPGIPDGWVWDAATQSWQKQNNELGRLSDDEAAVAIIEAGFAGQAQELVAKLKKRNIGFYKEGA